MPEAMIMTSSDASRQGCQPRAMESLAQDFGMYDCQQVLRQEERGYTRHNPMETKTKQQFDPPWGVYHPHTGVTCINHTAKLWFSHFSSWTMGYSKWPLTTYTYKLVFPHSIYM